MKNEMTAQRVGRGHACVWPEAGRGQPTQKQPMCSILVRRKRACPPLGRVNMWGTHLLSEALSNPEQLCTHVWFQTGI